MVYINFFGRKLKVFSSSRLSEATEIEANILQKVVDSIVNGEYNSRIVFINVSGILTYKSKNYRHDDDILGKLILSVVLEDETRINIYDYSDTEVLIAIASPMYQGILLALVLADAEILMQN